MKRTFLLVVTASWLAAGMTGCTNEDLQPSETCFDGIKNQDEIGVDCGGKCDQVCIPRMAATVNGSSWTAGGEKIESNYTSGSSTLKITGSPVSGVYPRIQLVYVGALSAGTHPLDPTTSYLADLTSFIVFDSGSITLTTVDTRNRVLNGTFSFTCHDTGSGTVYQITGGVFELVPY